MKRLLPLACLAVVALVPGSALARTSAAGAPGPKVRVDVVADDLHVANVFPTWGAQIPKVVYDGHWYYAATLDGEGTQYPWKARIWKSRNGRDWTQAFELPGHVYQPPGLVL